MNIKTVFRYDRAELGPARRTAEGYLLCEAFVAKPGIMEYYQADGSVIRELLPEETLKDAQSSVTLASKPVTLEHPEEMVGPDNVAQYAVGDVGEEIFVTEDGWLKVRMAVRRKDAIDAITRGKSEVSPGYQAEIDFTPGNHPEFGQYDAIQKVRRYNHLAIVDVARGGPQIRLRADSACQKESFKKEKPEKKDDSMEIEAIKGMYGEILTAINGLKEAVQPVKTDSEDEKPEKEETHEEKLDGFMAFYNDRKALEKVISDRKIEIQDVEKKDNDVLRREIVASVQENLKADASDEYIKAAFDMITSAPALKDAHDEIEWSKIDKEEPRKDSKEDYVSAEQAQVQRQLNKSK